MHIAYLTILYLVLMVVEAIKNIKVLKEEIRFFHLKLSYTPYHINNI